MIELFLTNVKFHLSVEKPSKFTFEGIVGFKTEADKILEYITSDPKDCGLTFFIKLPEEN